MPWKPFATQGECDLAVQLVEQYQASLRGNQQFSLEEVVARWTNGDTVIALCLELLLAEAEVAGWDVGWLKWKFERVLAADPEGELGRRFLQGVVDGRCSDRKSASWDDFGPLAAQVQLTHLRFENEPYGIGETLAEKYSLVERVGVGSFGVVFRGRTSDGIGDVAVKIPRPDRTGSLATSARLIEREAEALRVLAGPGVPHFVELLPLAGEKRALVMEFVAGETLQAIIEHSSIAPQWAASWVAGLCRVVARAHQARWLHRDIKPENVMVTEQGRAVLLDFGLALDDEARYAATTRPAMSRPYAPPETLTSGPAKLDGRSDVWALGALLYEVLSGKPYRDIQSGAEALMASMAPMSAEPFIALASTVPQPIRLACIRSLAPDPNKRFPTASAFADALEAAISSPDDAVDAATGGHPNVALVAWRLGIKLGEAQLCYNRYREKTHAIANLSGTIAETESKKRELARQAVLEDGTQFAAIIADCRQLAAQLGIERPVATLIASMRTAVPRSRFACETALGGIEKRWRRFVARWRRPSEGDQSPFGKYEADVENAIDQLGLDTSMAAIARGFRNADGRPVTLKLGWLARFGRGLDQIGNFVTGRNSRPPIGFGEQERLVAESVERLLQETYVLLEAIGPLHAARYRLAINVAIAAHLGEVNEELEGIARAAELPARCYERLFAAIRECPQSQTVELESARTNHEVERFLTPDVDR